MKKDNLLKYKYEMVNLYHNENRTIREIATMYNTSYTTLYGRFLAWDVIEYKPKKNPRKRKLEEYKDEIIDLYFNKNKSSIEIAKIYNTNASTIIKLMKSCGYACRKNSINSKKYNINCDFFSDIKCEEQAYWLGFMFADGYVSNDNHFGVSLNSKDINHLEKFKSSLNSEHPINIYVSNTKYGYIEYARLYFRNSKMKDDLVRLGCVENKSLILKYPKCIKNSLSKHFIRGYFDGDGTIGIYKNTIRIRLVGTKEFLEGVRDEIKYAINVECSTISKEKRVDGNTYSLEYGGRKKVKKVLDYMYEDANLYLERKYKQYKSF